MPQVGKKKYPYTKKGEAAAAEAKKKAAAIKVAAKQKRRKVAPKQSDFPPPPGGRAEPKRTRKRKSWSPKIEREMTRKPKKKKADSKKIDPQSRHFRGHG